MFVVYARFYDETEMREWYTYPTRKGAEIGASQARHDGMITEIREEPDHNLCAEWVPYMNCYRLYDPDFPLQTMAYVDELDEERVYEMGYDGITIQNVPPRVLK